MRIFSSVQMIAPVLPGFFTRMLATKSTAITSIKTAAATVTPEKPVIAATAYKNGRNSAMHVTGTPLKYFVLPSVVMSNQHRRVTPAKT